MMGHHKKVMILFDINIKLFLLKKVYNEDALPDTMPYDKILTNGCEVTPCGIPDSGKTTI